MAQALDLLKELRKRTGVGIGACKSALDEAKGDIEKAVELLRKQGVLKASKRASKDTNNGFIGSYVHNGQIGVLVELMCETDFVSRNEKFQELTKEIALHIAAEAPLYVSREDVPEDLLKKEKEIALDKMKDSGKPDDVLEKIAEGHINKFYEEVCLLEQRYVRDDKKTIKDIMDEAVASFGEKLEIARFIRIELGDEEK